jgi:pyruvate/2-oxoglutarate dehydrogenase complex dihydrolipoamide dehydrogenase (E3) component
VTKRVDAVVIGMGIAGEEVASRLLHGGLSVVAVERALMGGECKNWACVPTKMAVRSAELLGEARRIDQLAGHAAVRAQWGPVAARIRSEATSDWDDSDSVAGFAGKGGQFVRGHARLVGEGLVRAGDVEFEADRAVVLATGTDPAIPPIDGLRDTPYWTNRDAVQITEVPGSVVVLGGGAVGLEFAQVLRRFGAQVTLVEQADRLLANEEPEASEAALQALQGDGVTVHIGATVRRVDHDGTRFVVSVDGLASVTAEQLLVATGRRSNLADLGLETVGLDPGADHVTVDGRLRAGPGLWAVGDITDHGQFTHVGTYQARILAADILGEDPVEADYRAVPRVVFTDPEVAAVGLTQAQAEQHGIRVRTGCVPVAESARGWLHGPGNAGVVKLVADADRDVLVGATAAGPAGGEVIGLLTLAISAEVPLAHLRHMMYAYPTFHRAVEDALRELDRSQ